MDFLDKTCITCEGFTWWDGDYCCAKKMRILQESPDGNFNKDILLALKLNKNCDSYIYENEEDKNVYLKSFKDFLKENNL